MFFERWKEFSKGRNKLIALFFLLGSLFWVGFQLFCPDVLSLLSSCRRYARTETIRENCQELRELKKQKISMSDFCEIVVKKKLFFDMVEPADFTQFNECLSEQRSCLSLIRKSDSRLEELRNADFKMSNEYNITKINEYKWIYHRITQFDRDRNSENFNRYDLKYDTASSDKALLEENFCKLREKVNNFLSLEENAISQKEIVIDEIEKLFISINNSPIKFKKSELSQVDLSALEKAEAVLNLALKDKKSPEPPSRKDIPQTLEIVSKLDKNNRALLKSADTEEKMEKEQQSSSVDEKLKPSTHSINNKTDHRIILLTNTKTNLRSSPFELHGYIILQLDLNTELELIRKKDKWVKVKVVGTNYVGFLLRDQTMEFKE